MSVRQGSAGRREYKVWHRSPLLRFLHRCKSFDLANRNWKAPYYSQHKRYSKPFQSIFLVLTSTSPSNSHEKTEWHTNHHIPALPNSHVRFPLCFPSKKWYLEKDSFHALR